MPHRNGDVCASNSLNCVVPPYTSSGITQSTEQTILVEGTRRGVGKVERHQNAYLYLLQYNTRHLQIEGKKLNIKAFNRQRIRSMMSSGKNC